MLKAFTVLNVVISYDIICKWSIHFLKRMYENHPGFDWERFLFTYIIPKFHLPGHGPPCQTKYSFNYTKGVGRTHGETVEQGWANINLAALSTREMGPGARRVALNDSWSGWNWKKILGMGMFPSLTTFGPTTDHFYRRISPSKSVEGPPHEDETHNREQEVRRHVTRNSPRTVDDNDPRLGFQSVKSKPLYSYGERYF